MATTPRELAKELGTTPLQVRVVVRRLCRPNGENKHARWILDDEMTAAVRRELRF
jgi:hypothetical protein